MSRADEKKDVVITAGMAVAPTLTATPAVVNYGLMDTFSPLPVVIEENLFEHQFIRDQHQIFERAALAVGEFQEEASQQQLLNPRDTNRILTAMREAKLQDEKSFITVVTILDQVQQEFINQSNQYSVSYVDHPYFKALDQVREKIELCVKTYTDHPMATGYWLYKSNKKVVQQKVQERPLAIAASEKKSGLEAKHRRTEELKDEKRLFSRVWVEQQREQFVIATRKAGEYEEGRLLNADQTGIILNALRDAKAEGNVIETLAKAINAWQHTFEAKVGNNQHPYSVALNTVKANIADILATYHPAEGFAKIYHDELSRVMAAADRVICSARLERFENVCCIWACLIWCPAEYACTFCNCLFCCLGCCGDRPKEQGCELGPRNLINNDAWLMLWAPCGTMAGQCEDFAKQGEVIDKEKTKLNTMMLR